MLNIQLEKAAPGRRRKSKGLLHRLQAGTYHLPAHVTSEDDWQRDVPNVKLSRAFAIVLGIHVVAIGGFMAFELFRHKEPTVASEPGPSNQAASPLLPAESAAPAQNPPRAPAGAQRAAEPNLDDPANEGLQTYVVGPGETLSAIATRLKVDERLLAEKNGIGDRRPLESGMKLVIPNHQIVAQRPEDVERLLAQRFKVPNPPLAGAADEPAADAEKPAAAPPRTAPAITKSASKVGANTAAARPDKKIAAREVEKPTRKAELVRDAPQIKPNQDPRRLAAPPATFAAAQASRLSSASGSAARDQDRPSARKGGTATRGSQAATAKPRGRTHVVVEGDTAYRIARAYKVDVATLIKVNGIKPESLRPGTQLVIPAAAR